jgi:uncharacterized protein
MDAAFAPSDLTWAAVSPRLAAMRRAELSAAGAAAALGLGALLVLFVGWWAGVLVLAVAAAGLAWGWTVIGRNRRSWRYAERADDLVIVHGVLFRKLVVVPYGRMQFVDVTAGPVERWFGVAKVQLHTAAAATDARIPGLVPAEAGRLRDRLASRGEARSAGL